MALSNIKLNMNKIEYFSTNLKPNKDSAFYLDCPGEILCDSFFFEQLHIEKLRAQRSKSMLSIILLDLDKQQSGDFNFSRKILVAVRKKTRATDICGLINHKTIGILLPDTDEKGAHEICAKLVNGNNSQFSASSSTYPDHIFESLITNGHVRADAFPFELIDSVEASRVGFLFKRGFDIVGSIIGILLLMPVMLTAAIAIKITSPGPVIFKQIRLGKQGRPFTFYKFRSMHLNMDDQIHREYIKNFINGHNTKVNNGNEKEPIYKIRSDPRITKVGRFIRKTSIDELPQLFNVLKGDMSLVGPRPPLPYEAEKYQAWHLNRILYMKPGITGLWQVEGRSKTGWDDSVRLDIQYINNWSLLLDFKILIKTVKVVIRCSGAM